MSKFAIMEVQSGQLVVRANARWIIEELFKAFDEGSKQTYKVVIIK